MRRLFVFMIIVPMLLCTGCSNKQKGFYDRRSDEVIAASGALYYQFDDGSGTRVIYPDYFAGDYVSEDGKTLYICVTSAYNSELDFLMEKFDCVELNTVEYNISELYSLSDQYKTQLADNFPELDFFNTSLDEKSNCVKIELDPQTLENDGIMDRLKNYFDGRPVIFGEPPIRSLV